MLRESKHIYLILWVHHSCILLGFAKAPPLFDLPCEESPWRVNVEIWAIGQCCRNAEPRSLVDRLIQGHDWVVPVAGLRHSGVVSWNTLKHSKTTYLFAVPCNTLCWSTRNMNSCLKVSALLSSSSCQAKMDALHLWTESAKGSMALGCISTTDDEEPCKHTEVGSNCTLMTWFVSGHAVAVSEPGTHPAKLFVGRKASQKHVTSQLFVGHGAETH